MPGIPKLILYLNACTTTTISAKCYHAMFSACYMYYKQRNTTRRMQSPINPVTTETRVTNVRKPSGGATTNRHLVLLTK